ncbi:hypothetical protein A2W45_02270 [Candidatus Curtissbacteria bacterium RIFCSPHIGHO2_12_41_11]|uniref:Glutamyl-tRNA amidotransferase n=3 Tax=Candidatus Curtissiibacteriota TaxID=1752717 RepID=A0A1F5HPH0_9BACT|nr:MAG: hypothetical protein UU56_C0002G0076 [Candidatus Curtissbacteria bacterium GW2011_GWA2_41_24]OGD90492.1 MAG: hypothetical protein A2Z54_01995 [Candidatus Curtissbacteria bacterium RIFCSPHIGHO2_02_39_8]OGD99003.1 MAG: hypothetical protein A2W45_02270 [Candidatus Curtissbacteria bacterium RIFCSPHIGHO2_12_41_11]OGE05953.1 MAG: hypothetical protein A2W70_05625 [Candidatus Curtissbacteria bacterium RIFCSPLOWO2_02_41_11]
MAKLFDQISQDLNTALKQRDAARVSTLRYLISHLNNARIAKGGDLNDDNVTLEIVKDAKRHKESIEAFDKAKRQDLVNQESSQLKILEEYLPAQLNDNEIAKIVDETIALLGQVGLGDMAKVMGQVMAKVKDQADGAKVAEIVRNRLTQK